MTPVQIPIDRLSPEALDGLIEEFVTRDGTDYGLKEQTVEDKKHTILRQLRRGEVVVVFDQESESCDIVTKLRSQSAIRCHVSGGPIVHSIKQEGPPP